MHVFHERMFFKAIHKSLRYFEVSGLKSKDAERVDTQMVMCMDFDQKTYYKSHVCTYVCWLVRIRKLNEFLQAFYYIEKSKVVFIWLFTYIQRSISTYPLGPNLELTDFQPGTSSIFRHRL